MMEVKDLQKQMLDNRKAELVNHSNKELKEYFKIRKLENPSGYWKMNKDNMIKEILSTEEDNILKIAIAAVSQEKKDKESSKVKKEDKPKIVRKHKYTYKCINPEGEVVFTAYTLSGIGEYALSNMICNGDWVHRSIREGIPVMIGIKKGQTEEDFKSRHSGKYTGNFYRFTKEEIKEEPYINDLAS